MKHKKLIMITVILSPIIVLLMYRTCIFNSLEGKLLFVEDTTSQIMQYDLSNKELSEVHFSNIQLIEIIGESKNGDYCIVDNKKDLYLVNGDKATKKATLSVNPDSIFVSDNYVYYSYYSDIYSMDINNDITKKIIKSVDNNTEFTLFDNQIFFIRDSTLYAYDLTTLSISEICPAAYGLTTNVKSNEVFFVCEDTYLHSYNTKSGKEKKHIKYRVGPPITWSKNGKILFGNYSTELDTGNILTGAVDRLIGFRKQIMFDEVYADNMIYIE